MIAVYEAMVDRHGDIQQPSAIALLIASPVDTGNGIVGAVETGIRNCGGVQRRGTGVIDDILQGGHSGEERCLLSDSKRGGRDVLMQQALEGCRVEVEHLLIRSLVGEIGVDAVVDDRLAVPDAHAEGFQAVQRLRGQVNEREVERESVLPLILQQSRHVDISGHGIMRRLQAREVLIDLSSLPVLKVYRMVSVHSIVRKGLTLLSASSSLDFAAKVSYFADSDKKMGD